MSVWLPPTKLEFVELEKNAVSLETPVAGILISPASHGAGNISETAMRYKDFTSLVLDGRVFLATAPQGVNIFTLDPKIEEITRRYPYRATLVGMDMVYYSDRAMRTVDQEAN